MYPSVGIIITNPMQHGYIHNNRVINTYKSCCMKIHKHKFTITYIYELSIFIIHTFDTEYNMETHPGKTTKALFIWHEKYMAPLVCALSCRLCSRSLFLIYTDFFLLSCSLILYSQFSLYLTLSMIRT